MKSKIIGEVILTLVPFGEQMPADLTSASRVGGAEIMALATLGV